MRAPRSYWIGVLLAGATLTACAGGRGSSGFDISENAAIGRAIDTQQCVDHQGLMICPADQPATPTVTASPTPTPSATPYTPTLATPTATMSMSPTATATPAGPPRVDTGLSDQTSIVCRQAAPGGACAVGIHFFAQGFPADATFRVVARSIAPIGLWQLASPPVPSNAPGMYDATVLLPGPEPPAHEQFAVLAFLDPSPSLVNQFPELADTGAEYAFVTPTLTIAIDQTFPSPTPTETVVPESGPQITFFGIARADDVPLDPSTFDRDGRPVYVRPAGQGMFLVIEAHPGSLGVAVGPSGFDPGGGSPDMQVLVSRPLGDGSTAVCSGGVPATDSLRFSDAPAVVAAMNDFGCHLDDGAGNALGRATSSSACTRSDAPGGFGYGFVDPTTTMQYCVPIVGQWAFPSGDTIVAARVRDTGGRVGLTQQIVIRVGPEAPTPTASPTSRVTPPPTPTVLAGSGPQITYLGIARSDYVPIAPTEFDQEGRAVLDWLDGAGLVLVVEAQPGSDAQPVAAQAFDPQGRAPDLQLLVSRPLGDGSTAVCDKTRPNIGGVPGTDPLSFSDAPAVIDAMNDLGCRVSNGAGDPVGIQLSSDACTLHQPSGEFGFVDPQSTIQFCLPVAAAWPFQNGETIVAARLRDVAGIEGPVREIVLRIGAPLSTPTATPQPATPVPPNPPTSTPTPLGPRVGPQVTYFGVARADDVPIASAGADAAGRPLYVRPTGQGMYIVVEAQPGSRGVPVGVQTFDAAGGLPDFQILVSRPLGDGSAAVCDDALPHIGGVPGTNPPEFSDTPEVIAAINDLGCRVNDGAGNPVGRTSSSQACTRTDAPGTFGYSFVDTDSTIQYCLPIAEPWGFPLGDTIVAVQLRDTDGTVGPPQEIVIRVTGLP